MLITVLSWLLHISLQPYPWGDGDTTLFHNPRTNLGPKKEETEAPPKTKRGLKVRKRRESEREKGERQTKAAILSLFLYFCSSLVSRSGGWQISMMTQRRETSRGGNTWQTCRREDRTSKQSYNTIAWHVEFANHPPLWEKIYTLYLIIIVAT